MKATSRIVLGLLLLLTSLVTARSQFILDCACVAQQPGITVTNCQATIPDICALTTNCFRSTIQPPPPLIIIGCNQNPAAGTPVGPGTHIVTVTVQLAGAAPIQCAVPFTVVAPITGPFSLQCAPPKTVNCAAAWNFDPPTAVNPCCPNAGLPNGGVTITVVSTITNGVCPKVITRTWLAIDDCGQSATCSQTVTVVDTIAPTLDCRCLTNNAAMPPIPLTVTNCSGTIPDLCQNALLCASDNCGPLTCSQSPPAGTIVGPGIHPITVTVSDCASNTVSCAVNFTVVAPALSGPFTLLCAPNKTVECSTPWTFDPPVTTNSCCPIPGTTGNGVSISVLSTTTNGTCPQIITRTWRAVDACTNVATCSQVVTIVDTTPPVIDCACLRNNPLVPLSVVACSNAIPDLCLLAIGAAPSCATDNCGPLTCTQSPAAGTIVGPGSHPITLMVFDCASNAATCTVVFTVTAPATGCTTNPCPPRLTGVLNTGTTNGNGGLLPTGAQEQVWVNVAAPGGPIPMVVADTNQWPIASGPWLQATANSAWVSPSVAMQGLPGLYTNRVTFNAKCTNVCLTGRIASDDDGYLFVNGAFVTGSGFTAWSNVNHCANFVAGPNVIEFVVNNAGGPTGFRTELEFWEACCCDTNTSVWNTGMNGANPLATGQPDPNFVLISAPAGGCIGPAQVLNPFGLPSPPWVANGPNSQWIGGGPNANCEPGVYHYRLSFNLPCVDGASIIGQWAVDDNGAIHLNGQQTGNTIPSLLYPNLPGYGWFPVAITNGFVCGTNHMDFYVTNANIGINPTGFRAELTNVFNDCCVSCTNQPSCPCNFTNGGFDTSVPVNGTGGGWTSSGLFGGPGWQASGGNPGATFLLNSFGEPATDPTISQRLCCLTPGRCYIIRGQRKVQAWYGQTQPSFAVLVDGAPILSLPVPTNPADTNWHDFAVSFTATNTCQTISFASEINGTDVSYWIDNIRLECCTTNACIVSINCPTNLTVTSCSIVAGQAPVFYLAPTASSTCSTITNIVCTPPSGSLFPLGATIVNCTATDATGQSASCKFTVTLIGVPPLAITCSTNITVNSACGQACAVVNYSPPTVIGGTLVGCSPPSGTCFPIGTTIVTCRANNICNDRASCSFNVTVLPYVQPCAPPPPNMALWLPFDETSGSIAQNLAGGNTGTLINGPVRQLGSHVNNSLCFDGINDYVQVASHPSIQFGTGDFSIDAWIKPATLNNSIRIIVDHRIETLGQSVGYSLFLGGNNSLAFQIGDGNFINYPSTLVVPADGQWHLVAVTVSRSNPNGIRFYVDGVVDSVPRDPTPYPGSITPPTIYPLRVSSRSSSLSGFFPGCIDEVELFRRALSPSEITAIYNAGPNGKCRPGSNGVVPPLVINCPPNQTIFTCSNSATANFKSSASGQLGPIVCVPPSGSTFPIGTNTVTCTVTNICGATASCSFQVIVKPYGPLSPFPSATYWAGVPDNYAGATEPANVSACMISAFSGVPFKPFDAQLSDRPVGHRFTGLPNNIVKAVLVIRMKPNADSGASNDGVFIGLGSGCTFGSVVYGQSIKILPGAVPPTGGTWQQPNNGSTTFTLDLATLNPVFISKLNTDQFLDVVVHDDTIVDYMQLRIWRCPPPISGIGIPISTAKGTNPASVISAMAGKVLPKFGPIGAGPSLCINPPISSVNKVSEVEVDMGGANTFSFTTVLDMNAPEGAMMEIVDPLDPMGVPLLTISKECCGGGWDLKKCKGGISDRVGFNTTAVNSDGDLIGSSFQTLNEGNTNSALILRPEDGVTQFPITLTFNRDNGTISVTFPGSVERRHRKGWDGVIKGRVDEELLRKGWDGTIKGRPDGASIVTFTPNVPHPVVAPVLNIIGTGIEEWLLTSATLGTMQGATVHVPNDEDRQAAWFQSTAANDGVSVVSLGDGGGVSLDLGHSESFRVGLHHYIEDGNVIDSTLRVIGGPIRGLTNRPPPPVFDLRLLDRSDDVVCAVDFSPLNATSVRIELWSNGTMIAVGVNPGPTITPEDEFFIGRHPETMEVTGVLGGLRLHHTDFFAIQGQDNGQLITVHGDELRLHPEVPSSADLPLHLTALEYSGSEGMHALLFDLQRTLACSPVPLNITRGQDILTAEWDQSINEYFGLQGSENVDGPWFDLSRKSPHTISAKYRARYFRLICD